MHDDVTVPIRQTWTDRLQTTWVVGVIYLLLAVVVVLVVPFAMAAELIFGKGKPLGDDNWPRRT
jgi:hypothetical protein